MLLPFPPKRFVNALQKVCFQFVWNGRQDRIARKTTIKDVTNAGFNVPDIKHIYILALKLTWPKQIKDSKSSMGKICICLISLACDE